MEDQAIWEAECKRFDLDYPDAGRGYWSDLAEGSWHDSNKRHAGLSVEQKQADARVALVLTAHAWVSAMRGAMPKAVANA